MKSLLATIATAALLVGCAAPARQPLSTPSGRPEVTIQGASKKQVADAIVAGALEHGTQVKSVSDYGVVLARRADGNLAAALLYGSRYDSTPELRLHLNMVDVTSGVRVFGRAEMVTNPGSAFERINDVTAGSMHDVQALLGRLESKFKGSAIAPPTTPPPVSTAPPAAPIPSSVQPSTVIRQVN